MSMSTISIRPIDPPALSLAIGHELRRRRVRAGLSQARVATPFTRALVCAIERGRATPSISTLAVLLAHLEVDFDEFFRGVQHEMTVQYTDGHGNDQDASSRRRR